MTRDGRYDVEAVKGKVATFLSLGPMGSQNIPGRSPKAPYLLRSSNRALPHNHPRYEVRALSDITQDAYVACLA